MNREYLIKGLEDNDVRNYFNFMQKVRTLMIFCWNLFINIFFNQVAILLGADPTRAHDELMVWIMKLF